MISREGISIEDKLNELKTKYYNEKGGSNFLFKNTQKLDCAKEITESIPIKELLHKSFYISDNTNRIYVEYTILKMYANPAVYKTMLEYVNSLIALCIETRGGFELHVNLKTFTVTAANRYKDLIQMFCENSLQKNCSHQTYLQNIYLYNYPTIIPILTTLFSGFVDDNARSKLVLVK